MQINGTSINGKEKIVREERKIGLTHVPMGDIFIQKKLR